MATYELELVLPNCIVLYDRESQAVIMYYSTELSLLRKLLTNDFRLFDWIIQIDLMEVD